MIHRLACYVREKYIFYAFEAGLALKGFFAVLDIVGGILVYFMSRNYVTSLALSVTQEDFGRGGDFVSYHLALFAQNLSIGTQQFIAAYLLVHGLINLFLVINLFRRKLWAYPVSLVCFSVFIAYLLARFCFTYSPWLLLAVLLEAVIIWLIWHEYQRMLKHLKPF